jgi:undecaprenyl-diphosphatase
MQPILFDKEILQFFSYFAANHFSINNLVVMLADNDLMKGGVLVTLGWYIWFSDMGQELQLQLNRKGIFNTMLYTFVGLFITRVSVHLFPFRPRPFLNTDLGLFIPENLNILAFSHESSFPSDHATLFMALSYGIWKTNTKVGLFAFIYSVIFILVPRMYLGLHYPSDILIGSLIGIVCVELGFRFNLSKKLDKYLFLFEENKPQYFYPILFVLSYQIADLFEDSRNLLGFILHYK